MYELARGPLVWIALVGFAAGSIYKVVSMLLLANKEGTVLPTWSARHGLRSVRHWVIPFANRNTRMHPVFTLISFSFHACLLLTPLFVMGHAVLWEESWSVSWWSLPPLAADVMAVVVVAGGAFFILRRLAAPEVRNVSSWKGFLLVLLVVSPFLTGLLAHLGWLPHREMVLVHIISGALWLLAIPFTRLSHMLWFFFTRSYMGSEFGAVRNARDW